MVADSDEGREEHNKVQNVDGDHGLRDGGRRVFDLYGDVRRVCGLVETGHPHLLAHVSVCVDAYLLRDPGQLTGQDHQCHVRSATCVLECPPHLRVRCDGSIDLDRNDVGEVGQDVQREEDVLPVGQGPRAVDVHSARDDDHEDSQPIGCVS